MVDGCLPTLPSLGRGDDSSLEAVEVEMFSSMVFLYGTAACSISGLVRLVPASEVGLVKFLGDSVRDCASLSLGGIHPEPRQSGTVTCAGTYSKDWDRIEYDMSRDVYEVRPYSHATLARANLVQLLNMPAPTHRSSVTFSFEIGLFVSRAKSATPPVF